MFPLYCENIFGNNLFVFSFHFKIDKEFILFVAKSMSVDSVTLENKFGFRVNIYICITNLRR